MKLSLMTVFLLALAAPAFCSDRGLWDTIGSLGDKFTTAKNVLKEVYQQIEKGESPATIMTETIKKHPEIVNNLGMVQSACNSSFIQNIDYVGTACKFLNEYSAKIKILFDQYKGDIQAFVDYVNKFGLDKPLPKTRGLFDSLGALASIGDMFTSSKQILSEVYDMIKAGQNPQQIFTETLKKHPEIVNNMYLIEAACKSSFLTNVEYVGPACKMINQHYPTLKGLFHQYKDDVKAFADYIAKNGLPVAAAA